MMGRIVLSVIGVAGAALLVLMLSTFGIPALFSSAWILLVVAIGIITRQSLFGESENWPPARRERPYRGSDVSRLAWSINTHSGVVAIGLTRRITALIRHRLAVRGLDLDDPDHAGRIDALFGGAWAREVLSAREMRHADVDRLLDLIERTPPVPEKPTAFALREQTGDHHDGTA